MSRGLAATVTVLGTAVAVTCAGRSVLLVPLVGDVRDTCRTSRPRWQQLQDSDELSWLGDSRGCGATFRKAPSRSRPTCRMRSRPSSGSQAASSRSSSSAFTILFICLFLLTDVANLKRAPESVLMPGEDERWLNVWERVTESVSRWAIGADHHRDDRRHDSGRDRLAARLELRSRAGVDRGAARHDPQPRRHDRRVHPRADALGGGRA